MWVYYWVCVIVCEYMSMCECVRMYVGVVCVYVIVSMHVCAHEYNIGNIW